MSMFSIYFIKDGKKKVKPMCIWGLSIDYMIWFCKKDNREHNEWYFWGHFKVVLCWYMSMFSIYFIKNSKKNVKYHMYWLINMIIWYDSLKENSREQ
jgi:cobalamin biosynthesis protein CobD/CbiB